MERVGLETMMSALVPLPPMSIERRTPTGMGGFRKVNNRFDPADRLKKHSSLVVAAV